MTLTPFEDSVLADLERLSAEEMPLAEFVRAALARVRVVVPFDMGLACVLAPEAHYEQFVGCWPDWAEAELEGRAFATEGEGAAKIRANREGVAYRAASYPGIGPSTAVRHGMSRLISMPLVFDNEYYGSISLGRTDEGGRFTPVELEFARLSAAPVTMAIRRDTERQHVRQRLDRASALSKLAMMVNAGDRVEDFYTAAMPILREVLPVDLSLLKLAAHPPGRFEVAASDHEEIFADGEMSVIPAAFVERLMRHGTLSIEFATSDGHSEVPQRLARHGFARAAAAPLIHDGQLVGQFLVARRDGWRFTTAERGFLELFAALLTQAIRTNRRIEESAAEALEQRFIADLAEAVTASETVDAIATAVQAAFASIIPGAIASYSYVEGEETVVAIAGRPQRYRSPIGPYLRQALETGQSVPPAGLPDAIRASVRRFSLDSMTAVAYTAAVAGGMATGILFVSTREPGYTFNERELRLFRLAGRILGPAMENVRRVEAAIAEAEEERLIADVARVAAAATRPFELSAALQAPFSRIVPGALIGFGTIEGTQVIFPSSQFERDLHFPLESYLKEAAESGQAVVPATAVGVDRADLLALSPSRGPMALTAAHAGGVATGILGVRAAGANETFSARHLELFKLLANIVSAAMANVRAADELARENTLHQTVLGSLSDAVILFDHELRMAYTNQRGELFRRAAAPKSRARVASALPKDIRSMIASAVETDRATHGRTSIEMEGSRHWFDYENVPLQHRDFRILLIASDVTAEVLREEDNERHRDQLERSVRLAALGELISGVAHELNNPLTAILGFSEVIARRTRDDKELVDDLDIIQREAGRARDIVRDLLAFGRPNTGKRVAVDVEEVVHHVARLRAAEWEQKGIVGTVDCARVGDHAWADAQQITQVLLNLVVNAEQALAGRPNPSVSISAATRDGRAVISVRDNGAGMDEAVRQRIFEPFFTTKQGAGSGLGLSLSYAIAKAHDGSLEVSSKPGVGTTFTLELPVSKMPARSKEIRALAPAAATRTRVLVIDDEPNIRELCRRIVTSLGHDCETAESATAALRSVARTQFDLVVCDYRLGSETADAVVDGIRNTAPELLDRLVIATGATSDAGVTALCERYHLRLIAKPYGSAEIAQALAA